MKLYPLVAWFTRVYFILLFAGVFWVSQHPDASAEFAFTKYWHWRYPQPVAVRQWRVPVPADLVAGEKAGPFRLSVHRGLRTDPHIGISVSQGGFELSAWQDIYTSRGFEKVQAGACTASAMDCDRWRKRTTENGKPKEEIKVIIAKTKTIVRYSGSPEYKKYLEEMLEGMVYREPVV